MNCKLYPCWTMYLIIKPISLKKFKLGEEAERRSFLSQHSNNAFASLLTFCYHSYPLFPIKEKKIPIVSFCKCLCTQPLSRVQLFANTYLQLTMSGIIMPLFMISSSDTKVGRDINLRLMSPRNILFY